MKEQNLDADGAIRASDPASRGPVRYIVRFSDSTAPTEIVPTVPAGKTFIVTYISAVGSSGVSTSVLTFARCDLDRRHTEGNTTFTEGFVSVPMTLSGGRSASASESVFLPVMAGESLVPGCSIDPAPTQFFT